MVAMQASRRIRNWSQYNKGLIIRGDLTIWFHKKAIRRWRAPRVSGPGRPRVFSDEAIQCALMIRAVYHLPLRATQGILQSLIRLLGLDLSCPDYSTICRRSKSLKVRLNAVKSSGQKTLIFDSTGLKIYGQGEWAVRQHGISKRRTWIKVHFALNAKTRQVEMAAVSSSKTNDSEVLPVLLDKIEDVGEVIGDGGYDATGCYEAIYRKGAAAIIPPRKGAREQRGINPALYSRDLAIRRITHSKRGRKRWKKEVDYHRRSGVETAIGREKTIFGDRLRSRQGATQATECFVRLAALNKMTRLGYPKYEWKAA